MTSLRTYSGLGDKMARRLNKKGAELATNKVIIIIIALIVLAAVLLFLFRSRISEWAQSLPGYGAAEDKEIDVSKLPADAATIANCDFVGKVVDEPRSVWAKILSVGIVDDYARIYIENGKTNLLWYYGSGVIQLDEKGNEDIGTVSGAEKKIFIYQIWYDVSERSGHSGLPPVEDLRLIDGARILNDNRICKPKTAVNGATP